MGVTIKRSNNIPRLTAALQKLNKKEIKVGIFGDEGQAAGGDIDLVTLARVHEYGMTITPKTGKYLTIPSHPSAKGKSARDFSDLFFIPTSNGNGLLARNKGKDSFEVIFVLVRSVTIPERSFLRTGFDKNVDKITTKLENMLDSVLDFGVDPDTFTDMLGLEFAGLIQKELKQLSDPQNAAVTRITKKSSNPLQDTGRLVGAIRHKVE